MCLFPTFKMSKYSVKLMALENDEWGKRRRKKFRTEYLFKMAGYLVIIIKHKMGRHMKRRAHLTKWPSPQWRVSLLHFCGRKKCGENSTKSHLAFACQTQLTSWFCAQNYVVYPLDTSFWKGFFWGQNLMVKCQDLFPVQAKRLTVLTMFDNSNLILWWSP